MTLYCKSTVDTGRFLRFSTIVGYKYDNFRLEGAFVQSISGASASAFFCYPVAVLWSGTAILSMGFF